MTERLRGRSGKEQRQRRLDADPMCGDCRDEGRVTLANRVDHIVPLAKGGSDEDSNTRNLCEPCHLKRTAEQFDYKRNPRGAVGVDGWPIGDHPWNKTGGTSGIVKGDRADTGASLHKHSDLPGSKKGTVS